MLTNQDFCYWLQGYFEISEHPTLNAEQVAQIKQQLQCIDEPLGEFTGWLDQVITFFESQSDAPELLNSFLPEIQHRLNLIFVHVIDNSYNTTMSAEALKQIHDGAVE